MVVTQDGDVSGKTFPFCDTLTDRHQYEVIAVFKTVVYTDSSDSFKYYEFTDAENAAEFDAYVFL